MRKIILGLFWLVPVIYGIAALSAPFIISLLASQSLCDDSPVPYCRLLLPLANAALVLFAITPVAICITSAGALLQYHRRKLSTRSWAIACGLSFLIAGVPLTIAEISIFYLELVHPDRFVYSGPHSSISHFPIFGMTHLVIGILIVVAFRPRASISEIISAEDRPVKVKGDGTTSLSYFIAIAVVVCGLMVIDAQIDRWGRQHGLARTPGFLLDQLTLYGALLIAIAVHELGHIVAGWSVGARLVAVRVGLFHMEIKEGRWRLIPPYSWKCIFQGSVLLIPSDPRECKKSNAIWRSAGGPLASLAGGGLALLALMKAKGSFYESEWELLATVAAISMVFFVANLIPVREASSYSDGAHIYQILTGNVMADYRRIAIKTRATRFTPIRVRDFDISLIEKTASNDALEPGVAAFLYLVACDYYFENRNIEEAGTSLSKAEAAVDKMNSVWKEYCEWLVTRAVCIARSREMAEKWWERGLHAKRADPTRTSEFDVVAYNIVENHFAEAEGAWRRQFERTNRLPDTGERAFDLYCLDRLRQLFDEAMAVSREKSKESPMQYSSSPGT
ncbi:MAG: hypothetical protein WBP85_13655 [Terracidiphilus sp.]